MGLEGPGRVSLVSFPEPESKRRCALWWAVREQQIKGTDREEGLLAAAKGPWFKGQSRDSLGRLR